jgi:hypothetical protein
VDETGCVNPAACAPSAGHTELQLRSVKPLAMRPMSSRRLRLGDPVVLLPILHFVILKFSRHVAQCVHKAGYQVRSLLAWWHLPCMLNAL